VGSPTELRKKLYRAADKLRPLSSGATALINKLARRDPEVPELIALIERDPLLAPRVLQLVNSAAFGRVAPIASIKHAVAFLGPATLRRHALGWTIRCLFNHMPCQATEMWSMTRLIMHSEATAMFADILCDHLAAENSEAIYIAGLIHDIGKLLIASVAPDQVDEIYGFQRLTGQPITESEREMLATDHAELSGRAAERWLLPEAVQDAVRRHHTPATRAAGGGIHSSLVLAKADALVNSIGLSVTHPHYCAIDVVEFPGSERALAGAVKAFDAAWRRANGIDPQPFEIPDPPRPSKDRLDGALALRH